MEIMRNGQYTPEYLAERERIEQLKAERGETLPFEVGKSYQTNEGKTVTCIEVKGETARFSDGDLRWYHTGGYTRRDGSQAPVHWHCSTTGWRYNRNDIDRGRVTGTPFDHSDPRCVIPESV